MFIRLAVVAALVSISQFLTAQFNPKFGKISQEERSLMNAPGDSTAEAYVLYDHLDLDFEYDENKGPRLVEQFHRRLKLLASSSFDRADVTLRYNRRYEDISRVEAVIHLPQGGAIKLRKSDIIIEDLEDDRRIVKFTFPQVTEGAIIEYAWTKRSDGITIPTRYIFQENIPVRLAEYTALIPAYYSYVSLGVQGDYSVNEVTTVSRPWGPTFSAGDGYSGEQQVPHTKIRWAMSDLPAYEYQPYTNNFEDYIPKVRLQLQSVEYPGQGKTDVFNSWQETAEELYDRTDFGRTYRSKSNYGKLWREAEDIIEGATTQREKIDAAYFYVCRKLEWDERFGFLASESPNKLLNAGTKGNGAALNLALIALLREAGIDAQPLLVSLRNEGSPLEMYPILTQFDHLIVYTEVGGKPYLLDANGPRRPPGLPRVSALNHRGWIADPENPRWVDVSVPHARQSVMAKMVLDDRGMAEVDINTRLQSYYAFGGRNALRDMEKETDLPIGSEVVKVFPETEILGHEVTAGQDDSTEPLGLKIRMRVPLGMASDDFLYVQPVLLPMLEKELVDTEKRLYPIDFPYPYQSRYIASVIPPEGYAVEELPPSIRMVSEDGGITASYAAEAQPTGVVNVLFTLQLDRTVYPPKAYPALREMYRKIIELQESAIVLKRAK